MKSPICTHKCSATKASFFLTMRYDNGKASLRGTSPHHISSQKQIWEPHWPQSEHIESISPQFPLMCFHKETPCGSLDTLELQPPLEQPYFVAITTIQSESVSTLHNNFLNKEVLKWIRLVLPKPPDWIG